VVVLVDTVDVAVVVAIDVNVVVVADVVVVVEVETELVVVIGVRVVMIAVDSVVVFSDGVECVDDSVEETVWVVVEIGPVVVAVSLDNFSIAISSMKKYPCTDLKVTSLAKSILS
jgi:hypothetical protein